MAQELGNISSQVKDHSQALCSGRGEITLQVASLLM